jgi:hypothetical protein
MNTTKTFNSHTRTMTISDFRDFRNQIEPAVSDVFLFADKLKIRTSLDSVTDGGQLLFYSYTLTGALLKETLSFGSSKNSFVLYSPLYSDFDSFHGSILDFLGIRYTGKLNDIPMVNREPDLGRVASLIRSSCIKKAGHPLYFQKLSADRDLLIIHHPVDASLRLSLIVQTDGSWMIDWFDPSHAGKTKLAQSIEYALKHASLKFLLN